MTLAEARPSGVELAALVSDREYARLLEWPRSRPFEGVIAERARSAREWYAAHGRPWIGARRLSLAEVEAERVVLDNGAHFHGRAFAAKLTASGAHAVAAVALTAGAEIETEARRRWSADLPDEGFFLDRFGAAVAEQLLRWASVWVCRTAGTAGETVAFHLSPGCGGWPFAEQPTVLGLLTEAPGRSVGPVTMLDSGGLVPGPSLLAVLGLTRRAVAPTPADECRGCDLPDCAFRRAPYRSTEGE